MAEQMPDEQAAQQEKMKELEALGPELKQLLDGLNKEKTQEGKMKKLRRIFEILEIFKSAMPPEQYQQQFGELEQNLNQAAGQMEG